MRYASDSRTLLCDNGCDADALWVVVDKYVCEDCKYARAHCLYRHYDLEGDLLYVGITNDPCARWRNHKAKGQWWRLVAQTTYEYFDTREELIDAERVAITNDSPMYNKHGVTTSMRKNSPVTTLSNRT